MLTIDHPPLKHIHTLGYPFQGTGKDAGYQNTPRDGESLTSLCTSLVTHAVVIVCAACVPGDSG